MSIIVLLLSLVLSVTSITGGLLQVIYHLQIFNMIVVIIAIAMNIITINVICKYDSLSWQG